MNVSNAADAENIDPAMSAEKQAPGTPSREEIAAADAETPPPTMSAEALKEYEQIEAIAPERLLARLWNVVDSNNNGVIEMHEIAYSGVEAILEGWEGLDANKDGR